MDTRSREQPGQAKLKGENICYFHNSYVLSMMDQSTNNSADSTDDKPQWFNEFISDFDYQNPKPGQLLEGTVLSIEEDGILVDIGVKRDALVPARDLSQVEEHKLTQIETGDTVIVYVLNRPGGDQDLLVSLSKGIEFESWERADRYLENGTSLELEIVSHNRGGLIVEFETLRGFLPYSQVPGLRGIRNPRMAERLKKELVGKKMEMKVIEVVRDRNRLIFSATAAEKEKRQKRLEELQKGQIITGKVVNIVDFGAFVDLDGIDGLVHISELAWQRIKHPSEAVKNGEEIEVKVLDVDAQRERVSLSRKSLLPSPWEIPEELPNVGDCIEGTVVKIVKFGAFVELPLGIEGLVHTSQLGYTHSENPNESVKRGEQVLVRVLDVNPDRRRISLSMRQVPREVQIAWAMENFSGEEIIETPDDSSETQIEQQQDDDKIAEQEDMGILEDRIEEKDQEITDTDSEIIDQSSHGEDQKASVEPDDVGPNETDQADQEVGDFSSQSGTENTSIPNEILASDVDIPVIEQELEPFPEND